MAGGGRADAPLYAAVIEALWRCEAPRLRPHAAQLFDGAARSGLFGITAARACHGDTLEVSGTTVLRMSVSNAPHLPNPLLQGEGLHCQVKHSVKP